MWNSLSFPALSFVFSMPWNGQVSNYNLRLFHLFLYKTLLIPCCVHSSSRSDGVYHVNGALLRKIAWILCSSLHRQYALNEFVTLFLCKMLPFSAIFDHKMSTIFMLIAECVDIQHSVCHKFTYMFYLSHSRNAV